MQYIKLIFSGALFSLAWGFVPPYPKTDDWIYFLVAAFVFAGLCFYQKTIKQRQKLVIYGIATFAAFILAVAWYWYILPSGFSLAPMLPIIRTFYSVDGEASFDADISSIFIALWLLLTLLMYWRPSPRKIKQDDEKNTD